MYTIFFLWQYLSLFIIISLIWNRIIYLFFLFRKASWLSSWHNLKSYWEKRVFLPPGATHMCQGTLHDDGLCISTVDSIMILMMHNCIYNFTVNQYFSQVLYCSLFCIIFRIALIEINVNLFSLFLFFPHQIWQGKSLIFCAVNNRCEFIGANLRGAILDRANLQSANLQGHFFNKK